MKHHALQKQVAQAVVELQQLTHQEQQVILPLNQEILVMRVVKVIVHHLTFKVVAEVVVQEVSVEMHLLHLEVMLEPVVLE
jgi:hypothetical protein